MQENCSKSQLLVSRQVGHSICSQGAVPVSVGTHAGKLGGTQKVGEVLNWEDEDDNHVQLSE